jgi:LysR family transcriptional regulator, regulator for metE and metH
LLEGKLDLAIVCDPIRNRKIRYTPLFEDEVVIIVPPKHPWAGKKFVACSEFAGENLILFRPKEESTVLNKFLAPAGIAPRKILEVTLTDVIIEMVRGGLGVAPLAKWAVLPQLDSGALVGLSLTEQGFRRTWSAAQLRDARTPAYVEEFIRVLSEHPIPECVRPRKVTVRKSAAA